MTAALLPSLYSTTQTFGFRPSSKMSRLQVESFSHCFKQVAGPSIAFDPRPCFGSSDRLHRLDACLTALSAINKGLENVNAMEDGSLICSASNHDGVLDGGIDREFDLGLAEVSRYGGTPSQREVQFTRFVEHPLGVVPVVGEVLVVKHRHRAFALLENLDDLLVDPPARQKPVSLEIGWIIPVLCNDDNTIHSEFLAAKRDGFTQLF